MRHLAQTSQNTRRPYFSHVPQSAQQVYGENVRTSLGWQRVSVCGGDRIEQGNTHWVPIKLGLPPVGT